MSRRTEAVSVPLEFLPTQRKGYAMTVGVVYEFEGATLGQYDEILTLLGMSPLGKVLVLNRLDPGTSRPDVGMGSFQVRKISLASSLETAPVIPAPSPCFQSTKWLSGDLAPAVEWPVRVTNFAVATASR